jgi:hypothetical protein
MPVHKDQNKVLFYGFPLLNDPATFGHLSVAFSDALQKLSPVSDLISGGEWGVAGVGVYG